MDKVLVELTISRSGPGLVQNRGDTVEVGLAEAGRLLRARHIKVPEAKTMKAIAAFEKGAQVETAAAQKAAKVEKAAAQPDPAEVAAAGADLVAAVEAQVAGEV